MQHIECPHLNAYDYFLIIRTMLCKHYQREWKKMTWKEEHNAYLPFFSEKFKELNSFFLDI